MREGVVYLFVRLFYLLFIDIHDWGNQQAFALKVEVTADMRADQLTGDMAPL